MSYKKHKSSRTARIALALAVLGFFAGTISISILLVILLKT